MKIQMPNPSQEPPVSFKAPNQDLKDIYVLRTFNQDREPKFWNIGILKITDHYQINIRMLNSIEESSASSKASNPDLKDIDVLCTFKIKIESQNLDHGCIKDQG